MKRGATGIRSKGATRGCSPTLDNGWGHRGINRGNRKSLKKDAHEFEHGFAVSRETFVTVIANLVDVYERERRFEDMVRCRNFQSPSQCHDQVTRGQARRCGHQSDDRLLTRRWLVVGRGG